MHKIYTLKTLLLLTIFFNSKLFAQEVNPSTINIGGGYYEGGYYQFEWSIGEGVSIDSFTIAPNYLVTTGVLEPFTGIAINTNDTKKWLDPEIALFPIPTHRMLEVDIKVTESGKVNMQVYDQRGRLVLTKLIDYYQTNQIHQLDLSNLSAGMYFLNITLTKNQAEGVIRSGSFKIQKL